MIKSGHICIYVPKYMSMNQGESTNWPFHKTIEEKNLFFQKYGLDRYVNSGYSFPDTKSQDEARLILTLAILDYNERNGLTESI